MYLTHPLGISLCKIIINSNNMYSLTCKCIEICRTGRNKCLTFSGLHLCDASLMQNNTTDKLYSEMFHAEHSVCSLSDCCKCLRQNVIKCLSVRKTFLKIRCHGLELFVCFCTHRGIKCFDLIHYRINTLKFTLAVCAKQHFA